jgi:NAD(P) transhydrogenase
MEHFDIIVIGSGPAGEGAAMMAAKNQKRVAVIERYASVGGGCTHWGTIPSKALRQAVKMLYDLRRSPLLRGQNLNLKVSFPQLLASASGVINAQVASRQRFYERNRVPVFAGSAWFIDTHTIEVRHPAEPPRRISADKIVIATGSRPYHPPELDFNASARARQRHRTALWRDAVRGDHLRRRRDRLRVRLDLPEPRLQGHAGQYPGPAAVVHGRGDCRGALLPPARTGLRDPPQRAVRRPRSAHRRRGADAEIRSSHQVRPAAVDQRPHRQQRWHEPRGIGLKPDGRGQLAVNEHFQTSVRHIYAVGDVAGPPALASAGYVQGHHAVQHILNPDSTAAALDLVPSGIYTLPEISSVGLNERQLREQGIPYEIGHTNFKSLARAQMTDEKVGMLKILFHAETLKILGVHCFGDGAAEIVHIGQTVMASNDINNLRYFVNNTFNYPTMAEAYRVAAHNGLNRLT